MNHNASSGNLSGKMNTVNASKVQVIQPQILSQPIQANMQRTLGSIVPIVRPINSHQIVNSKAVTPTKYVTVTSPSSSHSLLRTPTKQLQTIRVTSPAKVLYTTQPSSYIRPVTLHNASASGSTMSITANQKVVVKSGAQPVNSPSKYYIQQPSNVVCITVEVKFCFVYIYE